MRVVATHLRAAAKLFKLPHQSLLQSSDARSTQRGARLRILLLQKSFIGCSWL
jgi:hypothetical protein